MNVFTDFHHASLLNSFIILFEKRMGGKVYRPIGTEWYEKGYWKVYDHPATVQQFLGIGGATPDGTPRLNDVVSNEWVGYQNENDTTYKHPIYYTCRDIDSGFINKAITYEGFMQTKIDIVIASIPAHLEPFRKLCDLHPSHPKLIYQIGNAWPVNTDVLQYTKNIMASASILVPSAQQINFVKYHQEFDTEIFQPFTDLNYWIGCVDKTVSSFVNCFNIDRLFEDDWQLFQKVEELMPDYTFKAYGGQCRDGAKHGSEEIARGMLDSQFIWHTKNGGDGYGHVLHNSAAVGRPLIFKKQYYYGKMGEDLMIDGITGIQIDGLSPDQIKNAIEFYSKPEQYNYLCKNVYNNFKQVVNFDSEFSSLQSFLQNLI